MRIKFNLYIWLNMQMHTKHTVQSIVLGKETFGVTVYPNVDYAFIVALVVILNEINEDKEEKNHHKATKRWTNKPFLFKLSEI